MFTNDSSMERTFNYFYIVFIILDLLMNRSTDTSYYILQVFCSIHILLTVYLCVLYSLGQRSLILKLFLECDIKFSVGRIQNGHTIDVVPDIFIWTFNWFHYLNYEFIPGSSSTCHQYVQVTSLGHIVSSYRWCNVITRVVPVFSSFPERICV